MTNAFVQAVKVRVGGSWRIMYRAMHVPRQVGTQYSSDSVMRSLVFAESDPVCFDTFEEANRVVSHYEEGPPEGTRRAKWCDDWSDQEGWGWHVLAYDPCRITMIDEGREDFHSDG